MTNCKAPFSLPLDAVDMGPSVVVDWSNHLPLENGFRDSRNSLTVGNTDCTALTSTDYFNA